MIALVALALAGSSPRIIELPDPTSDRIVIDAIAQLPEMGDRELAQARILAEILPEGTEDYSAATIRRYSSLAGRRVRCVVMPDYIRIELVAPKDQLSMAISLMDSMLQRASLPEESLASALQKQPYRFRSYWAEALDPWIPEYGRLRRDDVVMLYHRIMVADRLTISVSGAFSQAGRRLGLPPGSRAGSQYGSHHIGRADPPKP